jgi:ribosomal 30S subunit maturation factor RimM
VIQNTAQNVLDIESPEGKQILIPAVDAFLKRFDDDNGVIEVELIPGFL